MYDINTNRSLVQIIESWAITNNPMNSTEAILDWVEQKNKETKVRIRRIPFSEEGVWRYDPATGEIRNTDGTFFRIRGLVEKAGGRVLHEQPIIIQKEIGYLGIIGKVIDGGMYFLMQAKVEPGNVNRIQISPTIQATKSNFMQVHGGRAPAYLEYFSNKKNYEIIVDQIQSEQSSRFLGKRNRNIIIVVDEKEDVPVLPSHKWMTLGQIKAFMHVDNLVNMDTRTVISCIPFALRDFSYKELSHMKALFRNEAFFQSVFFGNSGERINRIFQYINEVKMLDQRQISLTDLAGLRTWTQKDGAWSSPGGAFSVIYCDIEIEGREVRRWQQPLLAAAGQSVFALIFCTENGRMEFLIHTVYEVGCFDRIEIGPSVQLEPGTDDYHRFLSPVSAPGSDASGNPSFLSGPDRGPADEDPVLALFSRNLQNRKGIVFSGLFSEEGGRFYQEQNRNILMRIDKKDLPAVLPEGYFWADFQTLNILIQFNNCLNIQLRNLLSILDL